MMMDFSRIVEEAARKNTDWWVGGPYYRIGVEKDGPDWNFFARFEDEIDYPWIPEET
jgi:hypothetical protein